MSSRIVAALLLGSLGLTVAYVVGRSGGGSGLERRDASQRIQRCGEPVQTRLRGHPRTNADAESEAASSTEDLQIEAGLFPRPSTHHISILLDRIRSPEGLEAGPTPRSLDDSIDRDLQAYRRSHRAVRDLTSAGPTAELDSKLQDLLVGARSWDVRCRALAVLVGRGDARGGPALRELTRSRFASERYIAWTLLREALRAERLDVAMTPSMALDAYAQESMPRVRGQIALYLGEAGCRVAIPVLMGALGERSFWDRDAAAEALGTLRAAQAVPSLIDLTERDLTGVGGYFGALGAIGSEDAITYLRNRVRVYGAADALVEARATAAVQDLLDALSYSAARAEDKRDLALERDLRLALVQLQSVDRCSALLAVVESSHDEALRVSAAARMRAESLACLQRRGITARLVAVYAVEESEAVREQCLYALEDSRVIGVTSAMLRHARMLRGDSSPAMASYVVWQLNRRLGREFETCEDAVAFEASYVARSE